MAMTMAMAVSPPSTPEGARNARPQSMYASTISPETMAPKSRPQSMMIGPPRSRSRLSMASSRGAFTRASDEEGKTAVKVVVRLRPPLRPSDPGFDLIPQRFQRSTVNVPTDTTLSVESPQGRKLFIFDRVFGEDTTQQGLWNYLEDSVDSFLQGYNVSILAYGQSGAGKSYTMGTSGPDEQFDPASKGIIPRAATHLFSSLQATAPPSVLHTRQNSGLKTPNKYSTSGIASVIQNLRHNADKSWQMSVTYVEIYNEQPRDLLLPDGTSAVERAAVQIREDPKGRIFVEGLRSVPVNTVEELMAVLNHGSTIRQTDATAINSRSSRSHAVFTVNLRQIKSPSTFLASRTKHISVSSEAGMASESVTVDSKLHFVDLAGSERLKNTGATGDRAKEGISINAGLASLGLVIAQLSSRSGAGHVSYRDSKLTRMLQDSLGGNAITYMVACVTPAEFHLSETLNTVQYAQRARNIQSKPKIQQVNDDADRQATIERLRSEVAFLRQQIRSAESSERKPETSRERIGTTDVELQNQLLDIQEGYRALSERHAKLVGEMSKNSRDPQDLANEHPAERLKRSQENQQQIEQIILEYEKTIQSLQGNLSTTRSSLATTESQLLEKETKYAYVETMNQQLNSRVQKLMEREATTESYLHELESRLESSTSGSESQTAMVAELRREMARIRESEINAEDYISTLEERLAESDQDMEIMQREVERLEHLVDRQRSLGRLDNLLYELDNVQQRQARETPNDHEVASRAASIEQDLSSTSSSSVNGVHRRKQSEPMQVIRETNELDLARGGDDDSTPKHTPLLNGHTTVTSARVKQVKGFAAHEDEPSPAQSRFMEEKFENVSQELFDLRLEHETALNDLDLMSAKYQEALRVLAEVQGQQDDETSVHAETISPEPISQRQSYFTESRNQDTVDGEQRSSSRSLSSELSLAGESVTSPEQTESIHTAKESPTPDSSRVEVDKLQSLISEHEHNITRLRNQYSSLQQEHRGTLDTVERLKTEAQRSRSPLPGSPGHGMIRRPPSQLGNGVDRGQRSIVALRSLLVEEFEDRQDHLENAEVHLTAATHELQSRMGRIQSLEADLQNVKKEMDMKSTIISGLTRERNSLKSGPGVDLSMVSQMRDQLIQKEIELKNLHEGFEKRDQELRAEIAAAKQDMDEMKSNFEKTKKTLEERDTKLKTAAAELEAALSSIETLKSQQSAVVDKSISDDDAFARAATAKAMGDERVNYQTVIDQLKSDLERQISTNAAHTEKIEELTQMHEAASKDIHEHSQIIQEKGKEIEMSKVKVAGLQAKIKEAESAVEFHKHGLKSLHEAHANEVEEMKLSHAGTLAGYDDQIAEMNVKHGKALNAVENETEAAKSALDVIVKGASTALGHDTSPDMLVNHITDIAEEKRHISEANKRLVTTNAGLEAQLNGRQNLVELEEAQEVANTKIANYQETIKNLANEVGNHEETIREGQKVIKRHESRIEALEIENKKKIVLIEELEQQLQNSYEQHQNRVSLMQQHGSQALTEAQQRISQLEKEMQLGSPTEIDGDQKRHGGRPQSPLMDPTQRSNSITSNLRKSTSVASLPSPPPAIPLPPLPMMPNLASNVSGNPSPPQSRHTSKEVAVPQSSSPPPVTKDTQTIKRQSAIIEDQDSRLRTMEKHLHAEKQLTATLEEALVDLETQSNKLRVDAESWKKKAWALEEEISQVRKDSRSERLSLQAVEEEVKKRRAAEEARAQLEERMRVLKQSMDGGKKKKPTKSTLNCF